MALDPRIALGVETPNIAQAFQQGLLDYDNLQQNRLNQELLQAQTAHQLGIADVQKMDLEKAKREENAIKAQYALQAIQSIKSAPKEQRQGMAQFHVAKLSSMGVDTSLLNSEDLTDDATLDRAVKEIEPYAMLPDAKGGSSVSGNQYTVMRNGQMYAINTVYDKSGNARDVETPIGKPGDVFTGRTGLTPEQTAQNELATAQALSNIKTSQAISEIQTTMGLLAESAARTQAAKDAEARISAEFESAVGWKNNLLPDLKEAKKLLETVKTGGTEKIKLEIANFIGDESKANADANVLQSLFYQNILNKLAQQTGTQTKSDQEAMQKTGGFNDKSAAANIAILDSIIKKGELHVNQARKRYQKYPDKYTNWEFDFGDSKPSPEVEEKADPLAEFRKNNK